VSALGDALAPAEGGDAVFTTQPLQHDADIVSVEQCRRVARRMSRTTRSAEGFRIGIDEFWLVGTEGGHSAVIPLFKRPIVMKGQMSFTKPLLPSSNQSRPS
jgi:hypothetical protein